MSSFIPAGRLSAVMTGDQRIEIQTEFSRYPESRIATTVSITGRVLHKIQKKWGKDIESVEEQQRVELLINKQHDEVTQLVHEHGSTLLAQAEERKRELDGTNLLESAENLSAVKFAFILAPDGNIHARRKVTRETELLAAMVMALAEFAQGMTEITSLGEHQDSVLHLEDSDLLLVPLKKGFLGAVIRNDVKKKEILVELEKLAGAA